jgi:hypothetical protein
MLAAQSGTGTSSIAVFASIGAVVAILWAWVWQAREVAELRKKIEEAEERDRAATALASATRSGKASGMKFGGLYKEEPGLLDLYQSLPGAPALVVAALLMILTLGFTVAPGRHQATPGQESPAHNEVAGLHATLDSLSGRVQALGDSLRVARITTPTKTAEPPHSASPHQVPTQRRAATPGPKIPPPPPLDAPAVSQSTSP